MNELGWNGIDEIGWFVFFLFVDYGWGRKPPHAPQKRENEDKKPTNESMKWKQIKKEVKWIHLFLELIGVAELMND